MSLFGEIVEPSTRTAWEDWDESSPEGNISLTLNWKNHLKIPTDISLFLVLEGKFLSDCFKSRENIKLENINSIPEVGLELYKDKSSSKHICVVKDYDILLSSEIVNLLEPLIKLSSEIITIQTKPIAEYKTSEFVFNDCILRSVFTTKSAPKTLGISIPTLEQPNIISGVSAGVICLRQHLEMAGIAIVCYMEYPEEYQMQALQKLLLHLDIIDVNQSKSSSIFNSNLYI